MPHTPEPGGRYVALGSSFAAGPGIAPVLDRGAGRSAENYAQQLARRLGLRLVDVTCSGATTEHLLHTPQRTLARLRPPQVRAVTPGTELVTITAGGNNLGYIPGLTADSTRTTLATKAGFLPARITGRLHAPSGTEPGPADFAAVTDGLTTVVRAVRERAPRARIVLVDYLPVLDDAGRLPLSPEQASRAHQRATGLARSFRKAADDTGVELLAASAAGAGHHASAAEPWTTGFAWGNPFGGSPVPYHPNLAGMTAVAGLLAELLTG